MCLHAAPNSLLMLLCLSVQLLLVQCTICPQLALNESNTAHISPVIGATQLTAAYKAWLGKFTQKIDKDVCNVSESGVMCQVVVMVTSNVDHSSSSQQVTSVDFNGYAACSKCLQMNGRIFSTHTSAEQNQSIVSELTACYRNPTTDTTANDVLDNVFSMFKVARIREHAKDGSYNFEINYESDLDSTSAQWALPGNKKNPTAQSNPQNLLLPILAVLVAVVALILFLLICYFFFRSNGSDSTLLTDSGRSVTSKQHIVSPSVEKIDQRNVPAGVTNVVTDPHLQSRTYYKVQDQQPNAMPQT